MRPDQLQRLNDLSEKLADAFLVEADPSEWPGDGKSPADISQQERGDRYWCKKNAMATAGVLRFALDLTAKAPPGETDHARDSDMDRKIAEAEKRASAAVARVLDKAKKKTFDERVHGKR